MTRTFGNRLFNARALLGSSLLVATFLLVPVAFVVLYSLNPTAYFTLPPRGLSVKWFGNFFALDNFRKAFWTSLVIATVVTPLSSVIALPAALGLVRGRFRGRELLHGLFLSPLIIPGVVTGIALLTLYSQIGVDQSLVRLVIAMTCFTLPFSVRAIVANLHGLGVGLEEAAMNLGATRWQTFRHVTLPQLRPGLLAGAIFVFVEAIDNFSIAVFLTDTRTTTLPVEAYGYIRDFDDPTVAAMATVLIAISTGLILLVERLIGLDEFLRLG